MPRGFRTLRITLPSADADRAEKFARKLHAGGMLPGVGGGTNELGAMIGFFTDRFGDGAIEVNANDRHDLEGPGPDLGPDAD